VTDNLNPSNPEKPSPTSLCTQWHIGWSGQQTFDLPSCAGGRCSLGCSDFPGP